MFRSQTLSLRFLLCSSLIGLVSIDRDFVYAKENNKVHQIPVTGQKDVVFKEGNDPCKVIKKYCKALSTSVPLDVCFNQLHPAVLNQLTSAWTKFQHTLNTDASFFIDCDTSMLLTPTETKENSDVYNVGQQTSEHIAYTANNRSGLVHDMLLLLERATQRDTEALSTFNIKRNELKLTDVEKLELYKKAILLLPNNLFIIDQLGLSLLFMGREAAARKLWTNAVARGLWGNPMQRPVSRYVPGLTSKPWYNTADYPFIAMIEAGYEDIRKELLDNLQKRKQVFTGETENLHVGGEWTELRLKSSGYGFTKYTEYFPKTTSHLIKCGQEFTSIKFSAIQPGTHIRTHTGPSNERLRLHLTLLHSGGAHIRVGNEWHTWEEGKVIMFDDSWEHEVKHTGHELRAVLIMDIWHPELPADKRVAH